ncbi:2-acylglycerol O-acyltransferase 2 [Globodera pallida]|uniref:Acyltransferase n=1 Tax=Globodera pallida TaxID=36090 RepID=A0A183C1K7_GLOPA|nr:2-acylglycerol O-acyltransferase 2 [Globodera pallida]
MAALSNASAPPSPEVPLVHRHFTDRLKQTLAMAFYLYMLFMQPIVTLPLFFVALFNLHILCAHPHGIVGSSSFIFFATNGANFASIFPDLKMHSVTLDLNFWFPLRREMIMASRMIPSNSKAIEWVLSRPGGGFAVGIVPGGAAEAMESFPGTNRLITARRKGFIKLAIKHGASIVPVFHFGETDVFHQLASGEGSTLRKIQNLMKRLTRISFPLAYGQSFLAALLSEERAQKLPRWLRVGFFPFRRRIVTVVGEPMEIEKNANCDEQTVDKIHSAYCERLRKLFDEHKVKLGGLAEHSEIEFV